MTVGALAITHLSIGVRQRRVANSQISPERLLKGAYFIAAETACSTKLANNAWRWVVG